MVVQVQAEGMYGLNPQLDPMLASGWTRDWPLCALITYLCEVNRTWSCPQRVETAQAVGGGQEGWAIPSLVCSVALGSDPLQLVGASRDPFTPSSDASCGVIQSHWGTRLARGQSLGKPILSPQQGAGGSVGVPQPWTLSCFPHSQADHPLTQHPH